MGGSDGRCLASGIPIKDRDLVVAIPLIPTLDPRGKERLNDYRRATPCGLPMRGQFWDGNIFVPDQGEDRFFDQLQAQTDKLASRYTGNLKHAEHLAIPATNRPRRDVEPELVQFAFVHAELYQYAMDYEDLPAWGKRVKGYLLEFYDLCDPITEWPAYYDLAGGPESSCRLEEGLEGSCKKLRAIQESDLFRTRPQGMSPLFLEPFLNRRLEGEDLDRFAELYVLGEFLNQNGRAWDIPYRGYQYSDLEKEKAWLEKITRLLESKIKLHGED